MEDARQQLVDRLKTANNILVTVSRNPSVDQLSALLGFSLLLNKQGKHAAAVFSGEVPSTLEFLKPEETFEKTTDSLRDFIIALDKNKADKLRYKVEDNVVRIFITPYKTSITQDDLDFSQGDFNVDLVVALGVTKQEDIDEAIMAHGRILHDATVASINLVPDGGLGTINWHSPDSSSLSELVTSLAQDIGASLDEQIATALLTGIVAETARFSNEKTSSVTMSVSAILMAAGANQQLVASKLDGAVKVDHGEGEAPAEAQGSDESPKTDDGSLSIDHTQSDEPEEKPAEEPVESQVDEAPQTEEAQPEGEAAPNTDLDEDHPLGGPHIMTEPPTLGGTLTSASSEQKLDPVTDPLSLPDVDPPKLMDHKAPAAAETEGSKPQEEKKAPLTIQPPEPAELPTPAAPLVPPEPTPAEPTIPEFVPPADTWEPPSPAPTPPAPTMSPAEPPVSDDTPQADSNQTLAEIEQSVQSPHLDTAELDTARDEVSRALNSMDNPVQPIQALNAQPIDLNASEVPAPSAPADPVNPLAFPEPANPPAPSGPVDTAPQVIPPAPPLPADPALPPAEPAPAPQVIDPNAPPPVPPPIPFQFGNPDQPK